MIRSFRGKTPQIALSAFVDETAILIGDVEIGENSGIWPGAVIRGDMGKIEIGNYCIIGAATLVVDNKKIPAYSLVLGVPGKITGSPSEKQLWWVNHAYEHYKDLT